MSELIDLLTKHTGPTTMGGVYECRCGEQYAPVRREIGQTDRMKPLHAAHVAAVLLDAGLVKP